MKISSKLLVVFVIDFLLLFIIGTASGYTKFEASLLSINGAAVISLFLNMDDILMYLKG